ncbi:NAD(P)/FAD-dependent oxidoreductase [Candidatus Omnitrophota bacterium]
MEKVDVVIIGAGIVGLSVASEVSRLKKAVYVLERHESFGQETSSRNSEVIHAGIYYPKDSLKAKTCVEGNRLTYEICKKNNLPHKKLGKLIVATNSSECEELEKIIENARANGVEELELLSKEKVAALEPNVKAEAAIYSGTTGIVDSHSLMKYFAFAAEQQGAVITYKTAVKDIAKVQQGYEVTVVDASGEEFSFIAETVINCAGLESDSIAEMAGIDVDKYDYRLKYCKGQYFTLSSVKSSLIQRLIYPVPRAKTVSLGIHATPNLAGMVRLGPDDEYVNRNSFTYDVDESARAKFFGSAVSFLPFLEEHDLSPDTSGMRPKLQGPGEDVKDFVIRDEGDKGFEGFINLIGIESPGLTAAASIAQLVKTLMK